MFDQFKREITYLRISVTEDCNLRCRYCVGEDTCIKHRFKEVLSDDEMIQAIQAASCLGIKKIRITGGEPLCKPNIVSFCKRVAQVEGIEEICITTNGIFLDKLAKPLKEAGVNRINMSLDTLDPIKYSYITKTGKLQDALTGLQSALNTGFEKIKINTVLIGGFNDMEIQNLAGLTKKYPVDVRFIELMPMEGSKSFSKESYINCSVVKEQLPMLTELSSDDGVARLFKLPDSKGRIGLITPISHLFCSQCNRIRLTVDGKIKPCLHSNTEISIKGLNNEEMMKAFEKAIYFKPKEHPLLSNVNLSESMRFMKEIGG